MPDSTDSDLPFMRTPYILLTKKTGGELLGPFDDRDALKAQKSLTSCRPFSGNNRKKNSYSSSIVDKNESKAEEKNISIGDVVLSKDCSVHRYDWRWQCWIVRT